MRKLKRSRGAAAAIGAAACAPCRGVIRSRQHRAGTPALSRRHAPGIGIVITAAGAAGRRHARGHGRWSTTSATSSRSSRRTASSATARTSARAACRSPPTPTCSMAGKTARSSGPARSARSLILARVKGEVGRSDAARRAAAERRADRARCSDGSIRARGRRRPSAPAPRAVGSAARARRRRRSRRSVWPAWNRPADRLVAAYLVEGHASRSRRSSPDAAFARRAYLDIWGLLPSPDALQAFVADRAPDKRDRLVTTLLADNAKYAEHWISFWNDLLRNDDGQTYFSEQNGGRQSITPGCCRRSRTTRPTTSSSRSC